MANVVQNVVRLSGFEDRPVNPPTQHRNGYPDTRKLGTFHIGRNVSDKNGLLRRDPELAADPVDVTGFVGPLDMLAGPTLEVIEMIEEAGCEKTITQLGNRIETSGCKREGMPPLLELGKNGSGAFERRGLRIVHPIKRTPVPIDEFLSIGILNEAEKIEEAKCMKHLLGSDRRVAKLGENPVGLRKNVVARKLDEGSV